MKFAIPMEILVYTRSDLTKVQRIAEGAYGIIYEVKNTAGSSFAVKRIKLDVGIDFVGCVKELDMLARLKGYPFILNLIAVSKGSPFDIHQAQDSPSRDVFYVNDRIYLITEKAAYDASSLIGSTNIRYIKLIMLESLLALEYIHGHKIIHRDIKPQNLLWFREGTERIIKFCDFGISKNYTTQETNTCGAFTPIYRAPEILMQMNDYDYRADVWSLGCVFYEFITKKTLLEPKGWKADKENEWSKIQIVDIIRKMPELPSRDFI